MAFNGTDVDDLDVTTPDGSSDAPSTLDDAIREIKVVVKNQYAVISKAFGDSPYTATTSDSIILIDASGGAVTVDLPAVATVSSSTDTKQYTVIKTDSSANAVTIDGDGAETIDGVTTATISAQYKAKTVTGDGTEWFTGISSDLIWPSFSVHKNGTQQDDVGTALEIITWSTEVFDTNSDFASNRFTPTVAGKYLLIAQLTFGVIADNDVLKIAIYKNGVIDKSNSIVADGVGFQTVSISFIFDANGSTDYFEIFGANITTVLDDVIGSAETTFFSGSRVGQ